MQLDDLDLSELRNKSVSEALQRLKLAETEEAKLQVIQDAVDEIKKSLSEVVVSRIKEDVTVANLDQIQLYLRKELSKAFAPLVSELKSFKSMSKQANDMKMKMNTDHMDALHDSFDVMVVRKPKTEIRVTNLSEIKPLEQIKVTNLSELQDYFNKLSEVIRSTFSIDVPEPKVTVNVPNQPPPRVNVDLNPLLESIQQLQGSIVSIKPSRTKYNTTDIVNALKEIKTAFKNRQTTYVTSGNTVDFPAVQVTQDVIRTVGTNGALALTNATAGVQLAADQVCIAVDISCYGGLLAIGSGTGTRADASASGIIVTPGSTPFRVYCTNLNQVYVSGATGTRACYVYYN